MELSPLVKWTGGKRSELPILKPLFPPHSRVVEPFSGGAAVAFSSNPGQAVLNDVSVSLIHFYETLKDDQGRKEFLTALVLFDDIRKTIKKDIKKIKDSDINKLFSAKTDAEKTKVLDSFAKKSWFDSLPETLKKSAQKDTEKSLKDKLFTRIPNLEKKKSVVFSVAERRDHLETAVQSGFYTTLRRVYNKEALAKNLSSPIHATAWFVVRSLCYSGMFRFSASGAFNVPYGGIGYNTRDFQNSVTRFLEKETIKFLKSTDFSVMDFEDLFKKYNFFAASDFVFVDPPYDSTFSQYNADADFTKDDQRRLAKTLLATKAPWMLVIKNTPFILSLYEDKKLFCAVFGKNYQVNFRNRHDRGVEHLIVTNYKLPASSDIQTINAKTYFKENSKQLK